MLKKLAGLGFAVAALTSATTVSDSTHTTPKTPNRTKSVLTYNIPPGTEDLDITMIVNSNGAALSDVSNPMGQDEYNVNITEHTDGSSTVTITFGDNQKKGEELTITSERSSGNTPVPEDQEWECPEEAGDPTPV